MRVLFDRACCFANAEAACHAKKENDAASTVDFKKRAFTSAIDSRDWGV